MDDPKSSQDSDVNNYGGGVFQRKSVITSNSTSSSQSNKRTRRLSESSSDEDDYKLQHAAKKRRNEPDDLEPKVFQHETKFDVLNESIAYYSKIREDEEQESIKSESIKSESPAKAKRKRKQEFDNEFDTKPIKTQRNDEHKPSGYEPAINAHLEQQNPGWRMMSKIGYKSGKGLGKNQQGIVEPIEPKQNVAKSGVGYFVKGLERGKVDWDFTAEKIIIQEEIQWIPSFKLSKIFNLDELLSWRTTGMQKLDISDSTDFCDEDILEQVLASKSTLDSMDNREFGSARYRSNPFETIGKAIFQNRAALKMANLDAILNFELTNPKIYNPQELFYFADVCAGPGGFSEYVLWKKGWQAKGFGFTLKGDCDFKLQDFIAGTPESFEPHYGVNGDGDIFNPDNIKSFISYVKANTDGLGVHLMMADGVSYRLAQKLFPLIDEFLQGFSVDGQENIQEILSKQLYLSQIVVAVAIVREGGNFICKLFDIFTPFSVGLIYLLRTCFQEISIHKPNTSRPANSERYVICKGRNSESEIENVLSYFMDCHEFMWINNKNKDKDILEIVPLNILLNDEEFHSYIYTSNNELGIRQIQNLQKIVAFYRDRNLVERRQFETKRDCLEFWRVPNEQRPRKFSQAPENPQHKFNELIKSDHEIVVNHDENELATTSMKLHFKSPWDWAAVIVGGEKCRLKRGFYLSLGGTKIYKYSGGSKWDAIDIRLELCKDTLIYGEIVDEVHDIKKPMTSRRAAFHIIDGMILGGKDIRSMNYWERHQICSQFAKAMNKPSILGLATIRVKEFVPMEELNSFLIERVHGRPSGTKLYFPVQLHSNTTEETACHLLAGGLLFLKVTHENWMIAKSRSQQKLYYFNTLSRKSIFEPSNEVFADFTKTIKNRVLWVWDDYTNFGSTGSPNNNSATNPERVQLEPFLEFIKTIPI